MTWSEDVPSSALVLDMHASTLETPLRLLVAQGLLLGAGLFVAAQFDPFGMRMLGWALAVVAAVCASLYRIGTRNRAALVDYQGLRPKRWHSLLHYALLLANAGAIAYASWRGSLVIQP
jgi:hypothetical protein